MQKLKRFLSLFLTMILSLSIGMGQVVQAEPKDEVAKLEIKVNGNGKVLIEDGYSKYTLENQDVFSANCTLDTEFKIIATPYEGYLISSVDGIEVEPIEDGESMIYEVKHKLDGTYINISFSKEENKGINQEVISEIEEENNNILDEINVDAEETKERAVSEKASTIIAEYEAGNYSSLNALEFRKELVSKYNLEEYVDSEFFFKSEYLKDLEEKYLGDLLTLIRLSPITSVSDTVNSYSNVDDRFSLVSKHSMFLQIGLDRANEVVMRPNQSNISAPENSVSYYEGGYFMGRTGVYSVNGRAAFCADHNKTDPPSGTVLSSREEVTNDTIRKILYYGSEGPAQISGWSYNALRLGTAMAISNIRHGTSKTMGVRLTNAVSGLASPPASFKAYFGSPANSSLQTIAYWEYSPKGSLQISKSSADPSITNGNNCYSIEGAEYGVFTNSNATGQIATLIIGANGWSQTIELDAGVYYIKEIKPPKGYALDNNIYPITVTSGSKVTKSFTDRPQADPIGILIRKVDADTGNAVAVPGGSLADAYFTIKYYAGEYADGVNPADLGKSPTRTWVMRTDERGFVRFSDDYKVSGDDFWYSAGVPTIPLGTVTIQETKAPMGYKLNKELFIVRITSNGTADNVNTFVEPTIKEDSLDFTIRKIQSGTSILLQNVKFNHTKPDGTVEELTTNANGEIVIRGLVQGVHKIVETKTIEGFEINKNEFVFEVTGENKIKVISNTTNMGMSYEEIDGNGVLTVENSLRPFKLKVVKFNDKNNPLEGAEFTVYSDRECRNEIGKAITNINGELIFEGLKVGIPYYFKETKAPVGFRIPVDENGNVHVYEVIAEAQPSNGVFNFTVDGVRYSANSTNGDIHLEGNKNDRVVSINVVNYIGMKLPATGSWVMIPLVLAGAGLMTYSLISNKKKKQEK